MTSKINNNIIELLDNNNYLDKISILNDITCFVVDKMKKLTLDKLNDIKNLNDNQLAIIELNDIIEKIKDKNKTIVSQTRSFENALTRLITDREERMWQVEEFLKGCGLTNSTTKSDSTKEPSERTYASSVGSTASDFVIECIPNQTNELYKIDIGNVKVPVVCVNSIKEAPNFTLVYVRPMENFIMKINSTVCTLGPGDFVDRDTSQNVRTEYAKRCANRIPCNYETCKYYHDPVKYTTEYSSNRNFAISYVINLIRCYKTPIDIFNNKSIRESHRQKEIIMRELAQIGGCLILRAMQLSELHIT